MNLWLIHSTSHILVDIMEQFYKLINVMHVYWLEALIDHLALLSLL